jgi:hypothetical protein
LGTKLALTLSLELSRKYLGYAVACAAAFG